MHNFFTFQLISLILMAMINLSSSVGADNMSKIQLRWVAIRLKCFPIAFMKFRQNNKTRLASRWEFVRSEIFASNTPCVRSELNFALCIIITSIKKSTMFSWQSMRVSSKNRDDSDCISDLFLVDADYYLFDRYISTPSASSFYRFCKQKNNNWKIIVPLNKSRV